MAVIVAVGGVVAIRMLNYPLTIRWPVLNRVCTLLSVVLVVFRSISVVSVFSCLATPLVPLYKVCV